MKMESFEKSLTNVFNRCLKDRDLPGEFVIRKHYKTGKYQIQKMMTVVLYYVCPGKSRQVIEVNQTFSISVEQIADYYPVLLEELLYLFITGDIWSLISTRPL